MPRKPAQRPWLAEGVSRSTWYRRRKQAREQVAVVMATSASQAALERLSFQLSLLRSDLERCARFADEGAATIAELAAMLSGTGCPKMIGAGCKGWQEAHWCACGFEGFPFNSIGGGAQPEYL
jgi:hypothetical protein